MILWPQPSLNLNAWTKDFFLEKKTVLQKYSTLSLRGKFQNYFKVHESSQRWIFFLDFSDFH